jgi:hypothetical protein
MKRILRGNGLKLLDEDIETAAFKILLGVYSDLVIIQNTSDIEEVLFVFQSYICKEYERLCIILKKIGTHYATCDCMDYRIKVIQGSIGQKNFMAPSEILKELEQIKSFKKLIEVHNTSCFSCIKLK